MVGVLPERASGLPYMLDGDPQPARDCPSVKCGANWKEKLVSDL